MNPSERIEQIVKEKFPPGGNYIPLVQGIGVYLNEEKERINDVLHEIVSEMFLVGSGGESCKYLHAMIDEKLVVPIVGNNNELHHD